MSLCGAHSVLTLFWAAVSPHMELYVCDDTLHRMVALRYHEIEGRDQTLPPTGSSVAGSSAADRHMSLNESSAAGMRLLPNEGINRSPAETSSHSSVVGSDDETDPEMPGLVDARPSMRADWPPRLVSGTFYSSNFNRPIFADYVRGPSASQQLGDRRPSSSSPRPGDCNSADLG